MAVDKTGGDLGYPAIRYYGKILNGHDKNWGEADSAL